MVQQPGGLVGLTTTELWPESRLRQPRPPVIEVPMAAPQVQGEWISCPVCGQTATIDPSQRRAEDFCTKCDFPLFWARTAVVPLSGEETGASLRRLPGTVGRAATASVACPHCGEPNSPVALICVRCSQPMVVVAPEPPPRPEPVYVRPAPQPEPEPEPGFPWGWVILACALIIVVAVVIVWVSLT